MGVMDLREQKSLNEDTMSETMKKFCTDCKTTKTPLWRGGPSGPKRIPPLVFTDQSNNKVKNDETSRSSYVKSSRKYSQACDVFIADQPVSATTNECSGNGKNSGFSRMKNHALIS
ncbi:hypothetical protein J1N35_005285 [Gossypium stocksii]|uniref:GATA-type domain-containing protein n=1 Tax=Gossypium stocksii TaxID=47602 RepID=A0A9D3WF22_9ROSI|nr:hypothetical protein J1N35_005285 [Gossypium stocksii]